MCQKATSMTILCHSYLLRYPESSTYDTLFVIESYGLYYMCSDLGSQSVFIDKIPRAICCQGDGDEETTAHFAASGSTSWTPNDKT